jgi:glutaminase
VVRHLRGDDRRSRLRGRGHPQPFTIQSISKPLVYGLAVEDRGRDAVLAKIGV